MVVSATGYGSLGLVLASLGSMANLVGLAVLARLYTAAIQRGEPAAMGLLALHGKTVMLLLGMALLGSVVGYSEVALGFALVTTCFTIATPVVALTHSTPTLVEAK